jgi:hypothetical protein
VTGIFRASLSFIDRSELDYFLSRRPTVLMLSMDCSHPTAVITDKNVKSHRSWTLSVYDDAFIWAINVQKKILR